MTFRGPQALKDSHDSVTCRRSPEVSSTAFDAQPPDLPPVSLMDMGFAIIGPLARHRRPQIRFLFIGSRLCSALLSGPASRRVLFHPCASLSLHVHHVVKVAVGIPVSWYPPHGSVRALLSAYGSYRG